MNKPTKYIIVAATVLASILALPILVKGVAISMATILVALALAGIFLLGAAVALALTSPLWIPFLAGWAAVTYCKKYYNKPEKTNVSEEKSS